MEARLFGETSLAGEGRAIGRGDVALAAGGRERERRRASRGEGPLQRLQAGLMVCQDAPSFSSHPA